MFQRVLQTRTQIEADLLISRLRAAGLHPSDLRVWPHVTLAGADLFYGVEVPAEEIEPASLLLRARSGDDANGVGSGAPSNLLRIGVAILLALIAMGVLIP